MIIDGLLDALIDSLKLLPFLFITYLLMEWLEEKSEEAFEDKIKKAGALGPLWGSLLGVVPQCGFSAAASSLYAGGIVTAGTVIAVFLSTSDEMLPIFLSSGVNPSFIGFVLVVKIILGMVSGFLFTLVFKKFELSHAHRAAIHNICEAEDCKCEEDGNIVKAAFIHTVKIFAYIFVISAALNVVVEFIGLENIQVFMTNAPIVAIFLAALIGLIPNCGASVAITSLYLSGVISIGAMMAGLLTSAGVGLLILFRLNKTLRETIFLLGVIYLVGCFWGIVINLLPIANFIAI